MVQIRAATLADRSAISAIHVASWRNTYRGMLPDAFLDGPVSDELYKVWSNEPLSPDDVVLVAEDDEIFGFIAIWCRPDPMIDNLHVLPGRRSKGAGRRLMQAAADALRKRGHNTAYLWVITENERAIRFYEELGGRRTATEEKDLFGYPVPTYKIEWRDLGVI